LQEGGIYSDEYNKLIGFWEKHSNKQLIDKYRVTKVVAIRNDNLQQVWERMMVGLELKLTSPAFLPNVWENHSDIPLRKKILKRMNLFSVGGNGGVKIIPLWHGTAITTVDYICATGFENLSLTDAGYFGKGIYGTPQAEYAARVYGKGVCLLCFGFVGKVYPVVYSDMGSMMGGSNIGNCDTHYAPVVPKNKNNLKEKIYYAIAQTSEAPVYDEFVIFKSGNIVPRYVVYYDTI